MPSRPDRGYLLSVILVNYNSSDFIRLTLKALFYLTKNPCQVLICDNGSELGDFQRLRDLCSHYPQVVLIARTQTRMGSQGHGEALNILADMVDTPYTAVLDADCIPAMLHWDQRLIDRLGPRVKIAGTPVAHNSPNNRKPTDFPLMFLCMLETAAMREVAIDFRPKDIAAGQDTGWELRAKFLAAGYGGSILIGENTRVYRAGPLAACICDEYYLDESRSALFCSHLGRGSNPRSGKYARSPRSGARAHALDKAKWLGLMEGLIDKEIRRAAAADGSPFEHVPCDLCGQDDTRPVAETLDAERLEPGPWRVVACTSCGLTYVNPRPRSPAPDYRPVPDPDTDAGPAPLPDAGPGSPRLLAIGTRADRLAALREKGWDVQVLDVEGLAAAEFPAGAFAFVDFPDGLDRLPSPGRALERIGGWLGRGGGLRLGTPHAGAWDAPWLGGRDLGWRAPWRLYHFTPSNLRAYLEGFEVTIGQTGSARALREGAVARWGGTGSILGRALPRLPPVAWARLASLAARAGRGQRLLVQGRKA